MEDLGVLASGEVPTAEEGATGMERLNWMLKSWQANGANLWRDTEATATFGAGIATVTLDPRPIDVIEARVVIAPTNELPLGRWELAEYRQIPNKTSPGRPVAFTLNKGRDDVTMTVWPVPVAATDVIYSYARVIEDVTDLTQTLDVPQQWAETVWMGLAARLANTFGAARTDPASVERITQYAGILEQKLLDQDRPASVYMGPVGRNWR
jgi:hypothetical protein